MQVICCDICRKPLTRKGYKDQDGKDWRDISFRERKYSTRIFSFVKSAFDTEYISVCGYCRSELAKHNPREGLKGE